MLEVRQHISTQQLHGVKIMRVLSRTLTAGMMMMVTVGSASAQVVTGTTYDARTIRVSGMGEFRAQPDMAMAFFAVETTGETAQEAATQNAERMDRVIQALRAAGVSRDDIQTSDYSLYPEYARENPREFPVSPEMQTPRIIGYRATNQVSVRTRDLEGIGELIDAGLEAGANRLNGVSFQIENADAAQSEALARAVADARTDAETIARALGVRLGRVLDASTASQPIMPLYRYRMDAVEMQASAAPPPPTPIEPGMQTVTATASLVYEIVQ